MVQSVPSENRALPARAIQLEPTRVCRAGVSGLRPSRQRQHQNTGAEWDQLPPVPKEPQPPWLPMRQAGVLSEPLRFCDIVKAATLNLEHLMGGV